MLIHVHLWVDKIKHSKHNTNKNNNNNSCYITGHYFVPNNAHSQWLLWGKSHLTLRQFHTKISEQVTSEVNVLQVYLQILTNNCHYNEVLWISSYIFPWSLGEKWDSRETKVTVIMCLLVCSLCAPQSVDKNVNNCSILDITNNYVHNIISIGF